MDLPRPRRPWDRTPVAEREYFTLLGPGWVAVTPPRRPDDSGSGEWTPPTGGAWVHLGADGRIRAFTGKAEVGQGTRLALAAAVASELRVAPADVEVVTGDTDLCPWDMGTFGSRSMPDAAPALAGAAAAAREALRAAAASRWRVSPDAVTIDAGAIRSNDGARRVAFTELLTDGSRVVEGRPVPPRPVPDAVAAPPTGGEDLVQGRRRYVSDLSLPGMWYGIVLRPPSYGARLQEVDTAMVAGPEVVAVREGELVAVAAPSVARARSALARLRPVWAPDERPDGPAVEAYLRSHPAEGDAWDADAQTTGDPAAALAAAPVRLTATYRTAFLAHVPLETRCALAAWDGDRVTIWVGTQTPFRARDSVAESLGVPVEKVRVIVPPTGSGFGGKHGGDVAAAAARLARAAGRPVRVAFTREEEFRFGYLRPMSLVDVTGGVGDDGRIIAWTLHNINGGAAALVGPYDVPNARVDNELSRSPLPQGSYRALGANANNFARESAIDELARAAKLDPVEFRRRNLADDRVRAVLDAALRASGSHRPGPERGRGVAVGVEKNARVATVAEVHVADGRHLRVERLVTAFEAGTIVHPANLRSQVEGAVVMALGGALFEAIRVGPGVVRNPRLSEYRVPRFSDLPEITVELVDRPDLPPSGAGETPMIAVAPAIANAICDATGVRLRDLPLVPTGVVPVAPAP